jgi:hypothetical protein
MLDVTKLEFKKSVLEGGRITIKIDSMGKLVPITKENLLLSIEKGYHLDKLHGFFTPESIKTATQEPKKTKKDNTNEGTN